MNPKNNEFKEYVLDQLRHLNVVECKPMFGGFGLYHNGLFFGIVADAYTERGMKPFSPSAKQTLKNYYEVPAEILEDEEQLAEWARKAAP